MRNKWKVIGLIFLILIGAVVLSTLLFLWGDKLGYITIAQKITVWLQGMLLLCAILLAPIMITGTRRLWAKDRTRNESLNPQPKQKIEKPAPFVEFTEINKYCRYRYGFFWRYRVKKILVIGHPSDVNQVLPDLINQRWLLGDRTLLVWGGDPLLDPNVEWLKVLKKRFSRLSFFRFKPLDATVWFAPKSYLNANRQQQAQLEKFALQMRNRDKALGWRTPLYLISARTNLSQQNNSETQAVGVLFSSLHKNKTVDLVEQSLNNLCQQCDVVGMQEVIHNTQHAFLLQLSQDLLAGETASIKRYLSAFIALPKAPILAGLFFMPSIKVIPSSEPDYFEHQFFIAPTWQTIVNDSAKQSGKRMGIPWGTFFCSLLLCAIGLMSLGMINSFFNNRALINHSQTLVNQVEQSASLDYASSLQAQYALQLQIEQLLYREQQKIPFTYRFGLSKNKPLLDALWPHYQTVNQRNIATPFFNWSTDYLNRLAAMSPADPNRQTFTNSGYEVLKAYLMVGQPVNTDPAYLGELASKMWQNPNNIELGQWQQLMPELMQFWGRSIILQPQSKQTLDLNLIKDIRQILINQIGVKNAENTIYQAILQRAAQNYANVTLVQLLGDVDSRMLFSSSEELPGIFTRKAWEDLIKSEIAQAARLRQEQIDWVLSDSSQVMTSSVSPEVLQQHLTDRYFSDYSAAWLQFLNNIAWRQADNVADVIEQLTLMSDTRQSPMIALMNVVKYHAEVAYTGDGLSDNLVRSAQDLVGKRDPAKLSNKLEASGPLTPTFGAVLNLLNSDNQNGLSLQIYLLRVTQVRLKLQNITSSANPQAMAKELAKSVFQGTSVDLTDTRDYGNLIAANLGDEWLGFGHSLFRQPLEQAWHVILTPAANSFNDTWRSQIVYQWEKSFAGRYPFKESDNDASLAELARFLRPNAGVIDKFITSELGGILEKQGDNWVINPVNSQGLTFTPEFINTLNLFNALSNQILVSGDAQMSFDLMARNGSDVMRSELIIDKQKLDYFNQMPMWQRFVWPGEGYSPYAQLSWSSDETGLQLYEYYAGDWALIRLLESAFVRQIDSSRYEVIWLAPGDRKLKYILRSQLGDGPLTMLKLRDFSLPKKVFQTNNIKTKI